MTKIEFVYFDFGNVIVSFDREIACRNLADLSGCTLDLVREILSEDGPQSLYESGQLTSEGYLDLVREKLGKSPLELPRDAVLQAVSDMFTPINSMVEVIQMTRQKVGRVGLLSNTCPAHWNWVRQQPWPVSQIDYDVIILSYETQSMKPDDRIYEVAEQASRVRADQILFLDDRAENVEAAKSRGWNAQQCLGGQQAKAAIQHWLHIP